MTTPVHQRINLLARCGLISLMLATPGYAQNLHPEPQSFAWRTGIELPDHGGPFYQIALPLPVYLGAQRADLGDLRIFNGQGEMVPYALIHARSTLNEEEKNIPVSLFPVTQSQAIQNGDANLALDVKRQNNGALIAVPRVAKSGKEVPRIQGAIIDLSQISEPVSRLHLETAASSESFHAFSIATSDDLQRWRSLLKNAQLVHLRQGGQVIDKDDFEWEGRAGNYVRILWNEANRAPAIISASVKTSHTTTTGAGTLWTDPIQAKTSADNAYDYPLPGHLPLEQLRINLPQANTLTPLQIQRYLPPGPHRERGAWETVRQAVAYRLQSPQGEMLSPDLQLNIAPVERLRLAIDASGGGIGNRPATVQIGFAPQVLLFLARGQGPFTLAWGAKDIAPADMSVTNLIPNYGAAHEPEPSVATLQPIAAMPADANLSAIDQQPGKKSKVLLWAALAAGLLVLAGMVVVLIRQMRQGQAERK